MAEQEKDGQERESEGTETNQLAMETTGERAPRSDLGGNLEERAGGNENDEEFDSTSGAGGTTAGGGTSGVPT
ncbi:MAG TPA: hypothetical protein VIL74_23285 [Pyrinomonadaceae bacterium]|jgi:hypothetical protein